MPYVAIQLAKRELSQGWRDCGTGGSPSAEDASGRFTVAVALARVARHSFFAPVLAARRLLAAAANRLASLAA